MMQTREVSIIRTGISGVLTAVMLAIAFCSSDTLRAQEMAEERCKAIMSIVAGTIHQYHGQISADLISDLQKKIGTEGKCDGPDEYRVWPNTKDREALGRLRQMIAAWDTCKKQPSREGCQR